MKLIVLLVVAFAAVSHGYSDESFSRRSLAQVRCKSNQKKCGTKCIPKKHCCTKVGNNFVSKCKPTDYCSDGTCKVCTSTTCNNVSIRRGCGGFNPGTCVRCPGGQKRCGEICISSAGCCTNGARGCPAGKICKAGSCTTAPKPPPSPKKSPSPSPKKSPPPPKPYGRRL